MNTHEPIFDIAHLAHVEIYSPKPEETVWFFRELLGMEETARVGQSVYLRAYEDFYHHTLKITEAREPGMGHAAWRATSSQALQRRVEAIEKAGLGQGWTNGDEGHGPAFAFNTPDGHRMEILWEVGYFEATVENHTPLKNRPQKKPMRGVPVRRLDHVNLMASSVTDNKNFMMEQLGFKLREHIILHDGNEAGAWMSVNSLVHDIAFMGDRMGGKGRFHHICYWYGYPQHLMDIADLFTENNIVIEAGPGKHGISQAYFMYAFEPGGNRVELFGDAGYLIFDPDWKPVKWTEEELDKGIIWYGSPLPAEYFMYGTPVIK